MTALIERALRPVDAVRGAVLRATVTVPPLRRLIATREARVPFLLSVHATAAFGLALFVPSLSLALTPLLLGVPHVISDVRHLVLRRALPSWWVRTIAAFAATLLAVRLLEEANVLRAAPLLIEHALGSAWILCAALVGATLGRWRGASLATVSAAVLIAAATLAAPRAFRLAFVHGHNLVAIAIWLLLFRRRVRLAWPLAALIVAGAGLLASGALLRVTVHQGVVDLLGLHLFVAADWLARGLPDTWALGLTMAFAFLQSVHYAIWLIAIPQGDARLTGPTTFRMTWRGLARDLGRRGLRLGTAMAAAVLAAGIISMTRTRVLFLSLATFHAWLELALLAFFVARDGLSRSSAPQSDVVSTVVTETALGA